MRKIFFKSFLIFLVPVILLFLSGCKEKNHQEWTKKRNLMVEEQLIRRGIKDIRLLSVMRKVPRHKFIPSRYRKPPLGRDPYGDYPVPIGEGQTISQPYIVALMTQHLNLKGEEKVLEIGTGSGYQAAILAEMAKEVYTIEILEKLANWSRKILRELNYKNVKVKCGDGYLGWTEYAPFDRIIVTCAPDHIPQPLVEQLTEGGRMIIPVGTFPWQVLKLIEKRKGKISIKDVEFVRFVPMTGEEVEKQKN